MIMSMYEGRIGQLERSLSRELINKDRTSYAPHYLGGKHGSQTGLNRFYSGHAREWAPRF
ncbi:hypothetical protein ANCDUO_07716 [Ancylostoma duodenale]|uniref:Uncharacterized protein n=1 Tax=Ancylostoma duodenale TaxID=51022 RepID=A0A0C2DHQ6_9BILA|nr:hypothetical protein ANCDUO_07716 [Ancylostoma duodenale]